MEPLILQLVARPIEGAPEPMWALVSRSGHICWTGGTDWFIGVSTYTCLLCGERYISYQRCLKDSEAGRRTAKLLKQAMRTAR